MMLTTKNVRVDTQRPGSDLAELFDRMQTDLTGLTELSLGTYIPLNCVTSTEVKLKDPEEEKLWAQDRDEDEYGVLIAIVALVSSMTKDSPEVTYPSKFHPLFNPEHWISQEYPIIGPGIGSKEAMRIGMHMDKTMKNTQHIVDTKIGKHWKFIATIVCRDAIKKYDEISILNAIDKAIESAAAELSVALEYERLNHYSFDIRIRAMPSIATNLIKIVRNNSDSTIFPTGIPKGLVVETNVMDTLLDCPREITTGSLYGYINRISISPVANDIGLPVVLMLGICSPGEDNIVADDCAGSGKVCYYHTEYNFMFLPKSGPTVDIEIARAINSLVDIPYKIIFPTNKDMSQSFKTKYLKVPEDEVREFLKEQKTMSKQSKGFGLGGPFGAGGKYGGRRGAFAPKLPDKLGYDNPFDIFDDEF